jgi:phytoene dehydrogenase-like protein
VPTSTYDVIALGDDLAGLVAATLCARRGLRVLVTRTPDAPSEEYSLGPHHLVREPLVFVGESSPALRRVLAELNFAQSLRRRLTPLRPAFQVVLPDARIDVGTDGDAFAAELAREFPADKDTILGGLGRAAEISRVLEPVLGQDVSLPPEGFWERRELSRSEPRLAEGELFPGLGADHPARALVALPGALTLGVDPRSASQAALLRAFDLWRRGSARIAGGAQALRDMMLEKLRTQHAGEVATVQPGGVVTKWGRAAGVTRRDRDEVIGANFVLCAEPVAEFGDLFGEKRPKQLFKLQKALQVTAYRYVLHLVMAEAAIPEGMAPVVFVVHDLDKPLVGDNAYALYLSEPDDEGRITVTVTANVPAPGDGENLDDLMAGLRARLRRRLDDVLPFSAEHTVCVHSPNQARPPEGVDAPAPPPILPRPLWTSELPAALGVGGAGYDVGLRHVVAASGQNLPGLGLEGDFAAGWCAARLLCAAAGKKKDYLKDEVLLGG